MAMHIWINDTQIHALNFKEQWLEASDTQQKKRKIIFDFKVTSEDYYDIATLLYKIHFHIRIPTLEAEFDASIVDYSTSITDLYKPNQVADYHLELIEQN
ncbi:DUF3219 family protein [Planococcus versutus]|uniref:DUF3219 domain-containing protein n=1 Tax=Planococcus versutus TaxID=1302659 RepID=A0A1B1S069_9BACL|nr:DUF3219 family protein [Planococcus versutus]ANU26593.1 hypothetical protein I858_006090 [Planococcus versutus]